MLVFFGFGRNHDGRDDEMLVKTTQVAVDHGGKRYAGLYSVSAKTLIIRIPGIGSRAREVTESDDPKAVASELMTDILQEAERAGMLT